MLMVIFGAGASYDSLPLDPGLDPREIVANYGHKPPLATELFSNRTEFGTVIDAYPECAPLIAELRPMIGSGIGVIGLPRTDL